MTIRSKKEIHQMYLILTERKICYVRNKNKKTPSEEKSYTELWAKVEALAWVLKIHNTKEP